MKRYDKGMEHVGLLMKLIMGAASYVILLANLGINGLVSCVHESTPMFGAMTVCIHTNKTVKIV